MLTVREMLRIPSLMTLSVIAGAEGLDREVSTVSVMDAKDIYNWMKGGEFLITSGGPIKDDPLCLPELIRKLDLHGASAFGIKTERFLKTISNEVIMMANELRFPLIHIPVEFAFTDIINPVLSEVVSRQATQLAFSDRIHKSFTELALKEEPIEKILDTLQEIIHRDAAFLDEQYDKLFLPTARSEFHNKLAEEMPDKERGKYYRARYPVYEIRNETTKYGALILGAQGDIDDENQNIALEHAETILILDTQKRISNSQIASRFRDEFIHDVLYNNILTEKEFNIRANLYHWDFTNGGLALIVDIDHLKQRYEKKVPADDNLDFEMRMQILSRSIERMVQREFRDVAYSKQNDAIIFLIYDDQNAEKTQERVRNVFEEVRREIFSKTGFTATVAVGRHKSQPLALRESYEEARTCLRISHNLHWDDQIVFFEKLGIYKLLNHLLDTEEAEELKGLYIDNLQTYDEKNGSEFLKTLVTLCDYSWNQRLASEKLFIHYNTMKYRFHKIEKILDLDFSRNADRINAEIAVYIWKIGQQ